MKYALAIAVVLVAGSAQAGQVDFDIFFDPCERSEKQECPTDKGKIVYGALAITECYLGARRMSESERTRLKRGRSELRMKPYSHGNCVKIGIVPDELRNSGGTTH